MIHSKNFIQSFYSLGNVSLKYSFSNIDENWTQYLKGENILVDYDDGEHIRVMKKFKFRNNETFNEDIEQLWGEDLQNEFFLRCYLPKQGLVSKKKGLNKLIIMFNGLNEILRFDFYDLLGRKFAKEGIASILLPTPYHLNRRVIDHEISDLKEEVKHIRYHVPTDYAHNKIDMYYYNYKKSILEIHQLVRSIFQTNQSDLNFYDSIFDIENLKISFLGYSLGGLRAIGSFIKLKPIFGNRIHSVITWNSGPGLEEVNVSNIIGNGNKIKYTKEEWKTQMSKVSEAIINKLNDSSYSSKELARICYWLYFSDKNSKDKPQIDIDTLIKLLGKHSDNFMSIQGEADSIVRVDSFGRILPKQGLHRVIIPDVDHKVDNDIRWGEWLDTTMDRICYFVKQRSEEKYSSPLLEEEIKKFLVKLEYYKTRMAEFKKLKKENRLHELERDFQVNTLKSILNSLDINTDLDRKDFLRLYYKSKAYYPNFTELVDKIIRKDKG